MREKEPFPWNGELAPALSRDRAGSWVEIKWFCSPSVRPGVKHTLQWWLGRKTLMSGAGRLSRRSPHYLRQRRERSYLRFRDPSGCCWCRSALRGGQRPRTRADRGERPGPRGCMAKACARCVGLGLQVPSWPFRHEVLSECPCVLGPGGSLVTSGQTAGPGEFTFYGGERPKFLK